MISIPNDLVFHRLQSRDELTEWIDVVRRSFQTVADDFGLTPATAPTNAAFIELPYFAAMLDKDIELYGVKSGAEKIGFVALEHSSDGLFYMEKLAVLPEHRHKKFGTRIMDFVFESMRARGARKISIAIINEHMQLKNWYIRYGFRVTGTRTFSHLPFNVCYLEKDVLNEQPGG